MLRSLLACGEFGMTGGGGVTRCGGMTGGAGAGRYVLRSLPACGGFGMTGAGRRVGSGAIGGEIPRCARDDKMGSG